MGGECKSIGERKDGVKDEVKGWGGVKYMGEANIWESELWGK